jgi:hypothetical protein
VPSGFLHTLAKNGQAMEERAGGYETGREETDPLGSGGSQAPGGAIGAFGKQEAELSECYVNL